MSSIVIVGGSIAGLTSGLMLARAGHQVTVLERDAAPMPCDVERAASWVRPTVPQVQHAHAFSALVIGVTTREHGTIRGDVVVDASGRRTERRSWGREAGVALDEWDDDCGFTVHTRFYRILDPTVMPRMMPGNSTVLVLDGFGGYGFLADNDTVAVALARLPQDAALQALRFPEVFDAAAAAVPALAPWCDPELTVPISPVTVMGGLRNSIRLPLSHGWPRLLGLHAIGDALATTNPGYGRGASLAMAHAEILADGLAAEPDSPLRQAELIGHHLTELTLPHWRDVVRHDRARINHWRATLGLRPSTPPPPTSVPMPRVIAAAAVDAEVWVRLVRAMQGLDPPQAVFDDPALAARIAELDPPYQPPPARRRDILAAIDTRAGLSVGAGVG